MVAVVEHSSGRSRSRLAESQRIREDTANMPRHLLHTAVFLAALTARAVAADPPPKAPAPPAPPLAPAPPAADDSRKGDDYRQFFKKPETTEEYWLALQYEIDVGRFDLASGLLHSMLAQPQPPMPPMPAATRAPTEDELVALE